MTDVIKLLAFEEGFSEKPYYCSLNYPTGGIGMRLGPRGAALSNYTFKIPRVVADLWCRVHVDEVAEQLDADPDTQKAWRRLLAAATGAPYQDARCAVYLSMAYQMGVGVGADKAGLSAFKTTNGLIAVADWHNASIQMGKSAWATQTPNRAKRHMKQFDTGIWCPEYK